VSSSLITEVLSDISWCLETAKVRKFIVAQRFLDKLFNVVFPLGSLPLPNDFLDCLSSAEVDAYVRGAVVGSAERAELEGSTAAFTKRIVSSIV